MTNEDLEGEDGGGSEQGSWEAGDSRDETSVALQLIANAVLDMPTQGVVSPHVPPSACIMVGLGLMEAHVSRKTIAAWLYKVADQLYDSDMPKT